MIYYNNILMPTDTSAILFMVENTKEFEKYADHEAAICIGLHSLVEDSIGMGENPIMLIEQYLEIVYTDGNSVEEIADFLAQTDTVQNALWSLKQDWETLDIQTGENSLMYGGISKERVTELFTEITLRTYLETLATYGK